MYGDYYCRCPDPFASLWNIGHCNLCGRPMRSHPTCKCCSALLKDSPDGLHCRMCYEDLQREVKEFWFAVGSVTDAAREMLEHGGCTIRQVSEEPQVFLVCLRYRDEWQYGKDLKLWSDGNLWVRSLNLYLLLDGGWYGNLAETRLKTPWDDRSQPLVPESYEVDMSGFDFDDEFGYGDAGQPVPEAIKDLLALDDDFPPYE